MTLTVGQELWFVGNDNRRSSMAVTVTKVGRVWADISPKGWRLPLHRIDIETLRADTKGFSCPGVCYLSQADYEAEMAQERAWQAFKAKVAAHGYSSTPSIDAIEKASVILWPNQSTPEGNKR